MNTNKIMENIIKIGIGFLVVVIIILMANLYLQKDNVDFETKTAALRCGFIYGTNEFTEIKCNSLNSISENVSCLASIRNNPQLCLDLKREELANDPIITRAKEYYVKAENEGKLGDSSEFFINNELNIYYKSTVNQCLFSVAVTNNNFDTCNHMGDYLKNFCYDTYDFDNNKVNVCGNDIDCEDNCKLQIARNSDSPENCEKIQDIHNKDLCYRDLAISLKDISLCTKQSESNAAQSKDFCETLYHREYGYPEK